MLVQQSANSQLKARAAMWRARQGAAAPARLLLVCTSARLVLATVASS